MSRQPTYIEIGDYARVELPYSEVCIHMRLAGQVRNVQLLAGYDHSAVAQILNEDGTKFSSPILTGEAGIYTDDSGGERRYYTYVVEE